MLKPARAPRCARDSGASAWGVTRAGLTSASDMISAESMSASSPSPPSCLSLPSERTRGWAGPARRLVLVLGFQGSFGIDFRPRRYV